MHLEVVFLELRVKDHQPQRVAYGGWHSSQPPWLALDPEEEKAVGSKGSAQVSTEGQLHKRRGRRKPCQKKKKKCCCCIGKSERSQISTSDLQEDTELHPASLLRRLWRPCFLGPAFHSTSSAACPDPRGLQILSGLWIQGQVQEQALKGCLSPKPDHSFWHVVGLFQVFSNSVIWWARPVTDQDLLCTDH